MESQNHTNWYAYFWLTIISVYLFDSFLRFLISDVKNNLIFAYLAFKKRQSHKILNLFGFFDPFKKTFMMNERIWAFAFADLIELFLVHLLIANSTIMSLKLTTVHFAVSTVEKDKKLMIELVRI